MERVEIVYRPYDAYTEIGEEIVDEFERYLIQEGIIHGLLGSRDELEMIIAENLRRRSNVTEKDIIETSNGEQTGE